MDQDNRNIRIFISSTFHDMHAEREELVKYTFPELRKRCRERGVELLDVDLRWGVTDEQKAEGQVLPICLAEIERCRPYFIGLLGERYGWVPDEIDQELIDDQPWLEEHREKSVTDLEIQHGVLGDPAMDGIAFFYFRNPEISKQVEAQLAKEPDYQPESVSARSKLEHLKKCIEDSDAPLRENYLDAKTLGQWILEDLWAVIDRRFPEDQKPTALERTRMDHEAFAAMRRKVYIGRPEYYRRLDEHVAGDGLPLVLLGESGSGKSALLANWAEQYRKQHPVDFLLLHFIGGTADSADYAALLRRIMQEIQERCEPREQGMANGVIRDAFSNKTSSDEIPSDPQKVIESFPLWLAKAAAGGRFILVLDALNQLEDRDNARDLGWLPTFFPANIRVILSTLPGRCLEALQERELKTLSVKPIEKAERKQFIDEYLDQYRKRLDQNYVNRIAAAPQSANPLYLRTLLEELRVFGKHETLGQLITHYLKAETADDLFERVLERLEQDYEQQSEQQGLVKKVMTLIWASRRGLSESEILELIELPPAVWSPLYLALEESLVSRSGLLDFFHDFLRQAVEDRYFDGVNVQTNTHLVLADFFENKELDARKIDELPWQLCNAKCFDRLRNCITDLSQFVLLRTEKKKYELLGYWHSLGKKYDMVGSYIHMIHQYESSEPEPSQLSAVLDSVAGFIMDAGRYKDAEPLYRYALQVVEGAFGGENASTAKSLNNLAVLLDHTGNYDDAESLLQRAFEVNKKIFGDGHIETIVSMGNLAFALFHQGHFKEAEHLMLEAVNVEAEYFGSRSVQLVNNLSKLAEIYRTIGNYLEAKHYYRKAYAICESVLGMQHIETALCGHRLATILNLLGDNIPAEKLYKSAIDITDNILGRDHPETMICLNDYAYQLYSMGDYDRAEPLYREVLKFREATVGREDPEYATSLNCIATLLFSKTEFDEAEPIYQEALEIRKKVYGENHPYCAQIMCNLAMLHIHNGDYGRAEQFAKRALEIREEAFGEDNSDTIHSMSTYADVLFNAGERERAVLLCEKVAKIGERIFGAEHHNTAAGLNHLADLLCRKGDYAGAEPLCRRALAIMEAVYFNGHPSMGVYRDNLKSCLQKLHQDSKLATSEENERGEYGDRAD